MSVSALECGLKLAFARLEVIEGGYSVLASSWRISGCQSGVQSLCLEDC